MGSGIWRRLGWWLLAIVVCVVGALPALVILQISPALDYYALRMVNGAGLHSAPEVDLALADLVTIFAALALWILPSAFAVGFALNAPVKSRLKWGLALSLTAPCIFVWYARAPVPVVASKIAAVAAFVLVVSGMIYSLARKRATNIQFAMDAIAAVVLTIPFWLAVVLVPREPPVAQKIWSVVLQRTSSQEDMNTGSEYNSRRQVVFVGDRLLVSFDSGSAPYVGDHPMSNYHVLSLDLQSGAVKNSKGVTGGWGDMPLLYATNDGHAILSDNSLKSLNRDLSEAGPVFNPAKGRVEFISPDGSTMAWETFPGTTLLDSRTLTPLSEHFDESNPTAVTRTGVLTDNLWWIQQYPHEKSYVTLEDDAGEHLLYHGDCGGRPEFLSDEKVFVGGCDEVRIIDIHGNLLHETKTAEGDPTFAGVSQDGRRFAVEFTDERGDPPGLLYDHFMVFDTESGKAIAIVRIEDLPENNSWSALSPDGTLFAAGSPTSLSLYRIP